MSVDLEMNRRVSDVKEPPASNVKLFIGGAIFVCMVSVITVATLTILAPGNVNVIPQIIGITTPITMALLAAGLHGIASHVDGKITQLIDVTAQKERLHGLVEGLAENPTVNLKKEGE